MGGPILKHLSASTSRLAALRQELAVLLEEPAPEEAEDHAAQNAAMLAKMSPEALQSDRLLGKIPEAGAVGVPTQDGTNEQEGSGPPAGFSSGLGFLQPLQPLRDGPDSDTRQRLKREGKKRGTPFSDEVLMAIISRIAVPTSGREKRRLQFPSNLSSRVSSRRSSRTSSAVSTPRAAAAPAPSDEELADAIRVSLFADQLVRKIASKLGRSGLWDSPSASGSTTPGGGVTPRIWGSSTGAVNPPARLLSSEQAAAGGGSAAADRGLLAHGGTGHLGNDLASQGRMDGDPGVPGTAAASGGAIDGGGESAGGGGAKGAQGAGPSWLAWVPTDRAAGAALPEVADVVRPISMHLAADGYLDGLIESKMGDVTEEELDEMIDLLYLELGAPTCLTQLALGEALAEEEEVDAILLGQHHLDALIERCASPSCLAGR
ncbi:hypothetical protein T484DRAFT_1906711 [Baffinella frigidus]|nr:hypothetical protein T484DRAFT_1906711 [Cryptophyta sp. CCMP2293]